jgi:DUF1365 family protein
MRMVRNHPAAPLSESVSGTASASTMGRTALTGYLQVRKLVEAKTGAKPDGKILLLTNLSYFGYTFNPVSFYYVYNAAGTRVDTVIAEVTNTPW